ncbi:MAG: 2,3-bisphosphoglycerate-independent phosphoglycerate mutase [Parcubacteria group bacterium]|nr:2,3-bisphosphoglycerate-independent phosphoglycerate mutase [Parcubacteria group bacterium]
MFFNKKKEDVLSPKVVLVILDGWGRGKNDLSNPLAEAHLPTIQYLEENYPSGSLQASGIAIGLPWGEVGNSEVGHLTIGAGKILYQHYPKITMAIQDGSFFENPAFLEAIAHVKKHNSKLHLVGVLTSGTVHAAFDHVLALAELAKKNDITRLYLHPFGDGRDGPPEGGLELTKQLDKHLKTIGVGKIATTCGRYFGMDRDGNWDRTKQAYELITQGTGAFAKTLDEAFQPTYEKKLTDEFIPPNAFLSPTEENGFIQDNDAIVFWDFREDSIRQIATPFALPNFNSFPAHIPSNLCVATMTHYDDAFTALVAFPPETVPHPTSEVVSSAGKKQLKIAETDKYAHVTYFFNGFRGDPFPQEERILVPSKQGTSKESAPEFMAPTITQHIIEAIESQKYDLIVVNYANADLIAHAGEYDLARQSTEVLDTQLQQIIAHIELHEEYHLIITSDHGNVESLRDPYTGAPETKHNINPVPVYIIQKNLKGDRKDLGLGALNDVAPTILTILNLPLPPEMTGKNLLG